MVALGSSCCTSLMPEVVVIGKAFIQKSTATRQSLLTSHCDPQRQTHLTAPGTVELMLNREGLLT